jgi:hypothetical protein
MSVEVKYMSDVDTIEIAYRGRVDKSQLEASIAKVIACSAEQVAIISLTDCSTLTEGIASWISTFLPRTWPRSRPHGGLP